MSGKRRRTGDTIAIAGDYQWRALHEGSPAQRFWHEAKLIEAERRLAPKDGDCIVDIGCGSGVLAARLAERWPRARVIGVDGNKAAINFARTKLQPSLPNLELRLGLADEIDLLLDVKPTKIVCLEVIEHLHAEQTESLLTTCHSLLPPGGLLVLSTPNMRSAWPLIEWTMDHLSLAPHMEDDQHVSSYHPASLRALAERVGFTVRDIRTTHLLAPWLAIVSSRIAKRVHHVEARLPHFGSLVIATLVR